MQQRALEWFEIIGGQNIDNDAFFLIGENGYSFAVVDGEGRRICANSKPIIPAPGTGPGLISYAEINYAGIAGPQAKL